MSEAATARARHYWETLSRESLARLGEVYAEDAYFRDPFNEVRGLAALRRVLEDMFERVEAPRFTVLEALAAGDAAFLTWDFDFRLRGRALTVHGASHLRFAADGRVAFHRDYWDAAGLYAQLPVIGGAARWLARRMRA